MITGLEQITSVEDLAEMVGVGSSGCVTAIKRRIARGVYSYTECGVRLSFDTDGIRVGSVVEGCGHGTEVYALKYPFNEEQFDAHVDAIEEQAVRIWKWSLDQQDDRDTAVTTSA